MNSLRSISRKIDAMLIMVIAMLALSLVLSWNYYQNRKITAMEKDTYAAELLAYNLPSEAAQIMEEAIARRPISDRAMKMRRVLADVYMNELRDYERALSELVFIKTFSSEHSEEIEQAIDLCLTRLGRVYDVERRALLAAGQNPLEADLRDNTLVKVGNRSLITADEVRLRLRQLNVDMSQLKADTLEALVNNMAQEKLLARAAKREGISKESEFLEKIRQFEQNLAITSFLERKVFADLEISASEIENFVLKNKNQQSMNDTQLKQLARQRLFEEKQQQLLAAEITRLAELEALKIDKEALMTEFFPDESEKEKAESN